MAQGKVRGVAAAWAKAQGAVRGVAAAWAVREVAAWDQTDNAYAQPVDTQRRISAASPAPGKNAHSAVR